MKILAINSSPRTGAESKTELMLNHLVKGMREAGGEVEVVNLREKKIKNCTGCFTCWTKTPGRCIHRDDMTRELFPKWLQVDMAVYATPLYYHTMNGAMSIFTERTLPAIQPYFELDDDGKMYHPLRSKMPAAVWLSVCGFPEQSEFDALSDYLTRTRHKDVSIVAEIYRSAAETMARPYFKDRVADILDATILAGRELVQSGTVRAETMARIRQPLVTPRLFAAMGNIFWKTCIAEGVTPRRFLENKMIPRPDSLDGFMTLFPFGINAEAAGNRKVIVQFIFSGSVTASCYFTIKMGHIDSAKGISDQSDLVIETPFDIWMDIMTRKADGKQMFMESKYSVHGDASLIRALFAADDENAG
jgi:multimeric flavodoxin WrbA